MDLALSRLFGGFAASFYQQYEAQRPPDKLAEQRMHLYHLYRLLNHAQLVGEPYRTQAEQLISYMVR
jgi:fructosamine-3-kinase